MSEQATAEVLADRYVLEERLGAGMMGIVWRARRLDDDEVVAIKLLRPHLAENGKLVRRFEREAEALSGIRGPHVVRLLDLVAEGDRFGLVTEYVPAGDLRGWLDRHGPRPAVEAARLTAQIMDGLVTVHAAGIVHRDVKPENILLRDDPDGGLHLVLSDFGIAHIAEATTITYSNSALGTPYYMAPEIAEPSPNGRRPTTPAADLYSAGVVLYEMLAGAPPFQGGLMAVLRAHAEQPPPPVDGCPPALWDLLTRLLTKDPDHRPNDAAAIGDLLRTLTDTVAEAGWAAGVTQQFRDRLRQELGSRAEGTTVVMHDEATLATEVAPDGADRATLPKAPDVPPPPSDRQRPASGAGVAAVLSVLIAFLVTTVVGGAVWAATRDDDDGDRVTAGDEDGADDAGGDTGSGATAPAPADVPSTDPPSTAPPSTDGGGEQSGDVLGTFAGEIYVNTPVGVDRDDADCLASAVISVVGEAEVAADGYSPSTIYGGTSSAQDGQIASTAYRCTSTDADQALANEAGGYWPDAWNPGGGVAATTTTTTPPPAAQVNQCIQVTAEGGLVGPYRVTEVVSGGAGCSGATSGSIGDGVHRYCVVENLAETYCYTIPSQGWITPSQCRVPGSVHVVDIVPGATDGSACTRDYVWTRWYHFPAPGVVACVNEF